MSYGGGERNTKIEFKSESSSRRAATEDFGRAVSKIATAQICESVGFEGFKESALDTLADIAVRFLCDLGKNSAFHANLAGRTQSNLFDLVNALEDFRALNGFSGASEIGKCVLGSGMVREIIEFLESNEETPFAHPVPQFPVCRSRTLIPSFEKMNETPPKHIPSWLPAFPDPHTYIYTPMWNERKSDPRADKVEQARQRRKAEMALLSLQQRLVSSSNGETGTSTSGRLGYEKDESREISNAFLARPLHYGEKDVSPVVLPAKLKNEVMGGSNVSVMEAFGPAIEAVKGSGLCKDGEGERKSLPEKRLAVHFKFRSGKKFLGEFLDTNLQKKGGGRSPSFERDDEKDDKKRRAEYILRQSIDNPQELTQL